MKFHFYNVYEPSHILPFKYTQRKAKRCIQLYNKKAPLRYPTPEAGPYRTPHTTTIGAVYPFMVAHPLRKGKEKMKTPTAKKLPSGSWFCRVRINGQDIGITKPTEKEAIAEAMALKAGIKQAARQDGRNKIVTKAIDDYISMKQNILSPSTIRGYRTIQHYHFQSIMHARIGAISSSRWQSIINSEARRYSPKTIKNAWGFMSTVIRETTGESITVRIPQQLPKERPYLDAEQVQLFLKAVHGQNVEIPALLALSSLRRSEIMALRWEDVDLNAGVLRVAGATVQDEHQKMVRKEQTKNTASRREVPIIQPLRTALESVEKHEGLVVASGQSRIYYRINQICESAGLPKVGVHGLRHSFASLAFHLGIPAEMAMEIGGWSDLGTMRKIYTHISKKDRKDYGTAFTSFFEQYPIMQNGNENGN